MALEMSQEFPTVSLDITNKASPGLSLVEKFARIAVYKYICRSSHWHPNQLSPVFAIVHWQLHFSLLLTEAFVWQLNPAFKKKINTFPHQQDRLHACRTLIVENPPTSHARSLVRSPQRPWLTVRLGNKISLLSRFGGWVLDVRIVLNSYFSITLKKKDRSFYWYFLWVSVV